MQEGPPATESVDPILQEAASEACFQCPVCDVVRATWTQLTKHFDVTGHCVMHCFECNAELKYYGNSHPHRHFAATNHRGIRGIFREKHSFELHKGSEQRQPLPWQFRCPCNTSFLDDVSFAAHMASHHVEVPLGIHGILCTCEATFTDPVEALRHQCETKHTMSVESDELATFVFNVADDGQVDSKLQSRSLVLFQCPDCYGTFTSQGKLEKHLSTVPHARAWCLQCGTVVGGPTSSPQQHATATGHSEFIGCAYDSVADFQVTVDGSDADFSRQLDEHHPPKHFAGDEGRVVLQCPAPHCFAVFSSYKLLRQHFLQFVTHKSAAVPEEPLYKHLVWLKDDDLLQMHPQQFARCTCGLVVEHSRLVFHRQSGECALRTRLTRSTQLLPRVSTRISDDEADA